MRFMDEKESKLSENPFERKSNPVIVKAPETSGKDAPEKQEKPVGSDEKGDNGAAGSPSGAGGTEDKGEEKKQGEDK